MVDKKKKHIEVLDENPMNASATPLMHDGHPSVAESAGVPRRGYFLDSRKPLIEKPKNVPSQPVAAKTSLGRQSYKSTRIVADSETEDEDWGKPLVSKPKNMPSQPVGAKTSLNQQQYKSTRIVADSETEDEDWGKPLVSRSANAPSQPPKIAAEESLSQQQYKSTRVIDDSDETADEDWATLGAAGLRSQYGMNSGAEVVAVKTLKSQSSKPEAEKGDSVPGKEVKPESEKGDKAPPKKKKTGSHNRKDQSDPTLASWAVLPKNIPNDGQLRNKFGRTKQEVIERRRANAKVRRSKRTPAKRQQDIDATKQWRTDNKEYVVAFDHLRNADKVANYTEEQVEEERVKARHRKHARVANELEADPVKGLKVPDTGEQLQKKCAVLTTLPLEISGPDSGLHVIICARKSWRAREDEHLDLEQGNRIMLRKFITDFVEPIPVLSTTSVVWHGRAADDALPWMVREDDDDLPAVLDVDLWNENNDERFSNVFADAPDYSTILIIVRGIDGSSIHVDSWIGVQTRYPKLYIVLAFTFPEVYVRFRAPADHDFFYQTEPYDERLYSFFPLSQLIDHVTGQAPLAKYAWLLKEWRVGTAWRQAISAAYQSGDQDRVNQVMAAYGLQRFRPRNGLPLMRDV